MKVMYWRQLEVSYELFVEDFLFGKGWQSLSLVAFGVRWKSVLSLGN